MPACRRYPAALLPRLRFPLPPCCPPTCLPPSRCPPSTPTDILLGYHSEDGWTATLRIFSRHYGLEAEVTVSLTVLREGPGCTLVLHACSAGTLAAECPSLPCVRSPPRTEPGPSSPHPPPTHPHPPPPTHPLQFRRFLCLLQQLYRIQDESLKVFVAIVPVFFDSLFKVWIFIGLNKQDPAAAVTLRQMDRH